MFFPNLFYYPGISWWSPIQVWNRFGLLSFGRSAKVSYILLLSYAFSYLKSTCNFQAWQEIDLFNSPNDYERVAFLKPIIRPEWKSAYFCFHQWKVLFWGETYCWISLKTSSYTESVFCLLKIFDTYPRNHLYNSLILYDMVTIFMLSQISKVLRKVK